jgi:hypothetical protein
MRLELKEERMCHSLFAADGRKGSPRAVTASTFFYTIDQRPGMLEHLSSGE